MLSAARADKEMEDKMTRRKSRAAVFDCVCAHAGFRRFSEDVLRARVSSTWQHDSMCRAEGCVNYSKTYFCRCQRMTVLQKHKNTRTEDALFPIQGRNAHTLTNCSSYSREGKHAFFFVKARKHK